MGYPLGEAPNVSLPPSVRRLAEEFQKLPGIGPKSADRLTHYILQQSADSALKLAHAIEEVKRSVTHCRECFNLCENTRCEICQDARRDQDVVCVVEQPRDLEAIERTGAYRGLYHVLMGRIAPLEGMTPDKLTINALVARVRKGGIREVILAMNPTLEGEGTCLQVSNMLAETGVKLTRLARGLASGLSLEYANKEMLEDALAGRRDF
jgi:recombination protein RecR